MGRRIGSLIEEEQCGGGVMLARMAGTEFLIGRGSDTATARAAFIAHRLIDEVAWPFRAGDHLIRRTARCGIARSLPGDDAGRRLLRPGAAFAAAEASGMSRRTTRFRGDSDNEI